MKYIYLDDRNRATTVTDEAYEQIVKLVQDHQICSRCEKGYTCENPCVAENTCLQCFLHWQQSKNTGLVTFLGVHAVSDYGTYYAFLGPKGYVYLSDTHHPIDHLEQDNSATLTHWGFTVPTSISLRAGERPLHG